MSSGNALQDYFNQAVEAWKLLPEALPEEVDVVAYQVLLHKPGQSNGWYKGGTDVLDCPEFDVAKIASAFSNEQRVRLLKAIHKGFHAFADLRQETSLNPGQLQHHLKELALSNFLEETGKRNHYELSRRGKALLLLMLNIGKWQPDVDEPNYLSPDQVTIST